MFEIYLVLCLPEKTGCKNTRKPIDKSKIPHGSPVPLLIDQPIVCEMKTTGGNKALFF